MAKTINEAEIDLLIERLVSRTQKANEIFLLNIGKYIKQIKNLSPSKAYQLVQILKYGGNFDEIMNKIMEYSGMNIQDVDEIFSNYAKRDQYFYEKFYRYRNIPFIPFNENTALKSQTMALANIVKTEMYDYFRKNVLGYSVKDIKGNTIFKGMKDVYNEMLDTALLNVGQGKETFDSSIRKILNEVGTSGLKTINYASGRSVRLDSALSMHLKSRLNELHNENEKLFGEEFGSDGIEISVHLNPAPDHEKVQGRQFSNEEFEKLQNGMLARDYKNKMYSLDDNGNGRYRPIGELNCYHYIFSIILGVSEPEYSDSELKNIINKNEEGFEFEGKHYTNYEGTQLQRQLERKIREQKDVQILARASDNQELIATSQDNITKLTRKYKELSDASGLPTKMDRLAVSGYRRVKVKKPVNDYKQKPVVDASKSMTEYEDFDFEESFMVLSRELDDKNVDVMSGMYKLNNKLAIKNMEQLDYLTDKYMHDAYFTKPLQLDTFIGKGRTYGQASYQNHKIQLAKNYYSDRTLFMEKQKKDIESRWHYEVPDDKLDVYTLTHEYGHIVEYNYLEKIRLNYLKTGRRFSYKQADVDLKDTIVSNAMRKLDTKMTITEFKNKYFSRYAMSKRNYEWFAECFAKMELGEQDVFTEALREWLVKFYE